MKTKLQYLFIALALSASLHQAAAQGTGFTYQGQLKDGATPANGAYNLKFTLFDALTAGNQVGISVTDSPVALSNGLFTVSLDFGANFPGANRWLEIGVRTNGGSAYATLTPRQPLTPTPYAIQAGNAGTLGGQSATAYVAKAGDTMTGTLRLSPPAVLAFGAGTRQMISLYDNPPYDFGIGVQTSTFYQRTDIGGGFAWYEGGVHDNAQNNPGGGTALMTLDSYGDVVVPGSVSAATILGTINGINAFSAGVSGENTGNGKGVYGSSSTANGFGIYGVNTGGGKAGYFEGDVGVAGQLAANGGMVGDKGSIPFGNGVYGNSAAGNGVGVYGNNTGGGIGVYGNGGGKGVYGRATVAGPTHAGVYGENSAAGGTAVIGTALNVNSAGVAGVADTAGSTGVYGRGNLWAGYFDGNVSVCTLTIRGGCDVAEPFQMSAKEIPKGAVVVIDDENAGQLKLSETAYDQRVAGFVSGANGIKSGISLHQEGVVEGGQNVALSGRVYVLADASGGAIKPGDLLTTSTTPGHAMRVTDHNKAQGAILGKAMSALNDGKGMVLVLVTLQ
jgi:hypothetical protein